MASLINDPFRFENPTVLSRIFRVINVLGLSFTSVRSVVNCVFRFVTGVRAESPNSDRPIDLNQQDDAMNLEKFSTCIDNMNFMYPEIFSGADSFTSFNEFCLAEGLSYSAVFVSERDTCRFCNGKLVTNCCRAPARQHTILGISLDPVLRADVCELESGSGVCLSFLLIVVIPGNSTFEDFFWGEIKQYFLIACACFRLLISM